MISGYSYQAAMKTPAAEETAAIRSEQLRSLYATIPAAVSGNALIASILAGMQWTVVAAPVVIIWLVFMMVALGARMLLFVVHRRAVDGDDSVWLQRFRVSIAAIGVVWGLASLLIFPAHDIPHQVFLTFALGGVTSAAITTLSIDRVSSLAFTVPALTAVIVRLFIEGSAIHMGMGVMVVLFFLFTVVISRRAYRTLCENVILHISIAKREQALIKALSEADRANHAKSEFLSRMSHELRTPMNAIMGFSQLLAIDQEAPLTPEQGDYVNEILYAGQHLLELINEVLDLARIESGRIELSLEPVEVTQLVDECIALLQPIIAGHDIKVTLDTTNVSVVQADRLRLRQVLLNLLSNAIKYNRKGGSVRIACYSVKDGNAVNLMFSPAGENGGDENKLAALSDSRVRIMVSDSGRGIEVDALPRLFKPFERMESAYDGIEGAGIGLALSKRLVEAMAGTIGVESVAGEGSTFWVELPVAKAAVCPPSDAVGAEDGKKTYATVRTLLYVEDNPANLHLVQRIISRHTGLKLLDARNAEQGLEIAGTQHPDLILLDINLPGMDGFEVLRHLQNDPATCGIPVVAVTANAMERDIKKGLAAGFVDYLTKPLDIQKLLRLLDTIFK